MPGPLAAILMIGMTVAVYLSMSRLYRRFHLPFLIPALTSTLIIIIILACFRIPYDTYMIGGQWINHLMGPAVVSLAYPLYKQKNILINNLVPIFGGVIAGSLTGILSGFFFAHALGFSKELLLSIVPKSVTTPVAMQIASELGGIPPLAAVFVMFAGFSAVLGLYIFKSFRIKSPVGQGIALGSASHAIGTSMAYEYGETVFSMSSIAMILSAILGSVFGPLIVWLIY